jgi:diguanylate cyclase (GGDEF)-like protein
MSKTYVGSQAVRVPRWYAPVLRSGGQGYALVRVSFGRRLAVFFLLIAIVPTAALLAILIFISHDSQRGKADARIAAGLQTAIEVYDRRVEDAGSVARRLAGDPALVAAMRGPPTALQGWTRRAVHEQGVVRVEVLDSTGGGRAAAGTADAVAVAHVGLTRDSLPVGSLRVSTTTGPELIEDIKALTGRELVLRSGGAVLASTIPPPSQTLGPDETADVSAGGVEYRAHELALNRADQESLLIMGPKDTGGVFGVGRPALGIMIWFLVTAIVLAWILARTLTRLHQRVETQAITDPLTGLYNRRHLAETLDREVSRALRFGHEMSLIIIDVDDFKKINDRLGHLQGDIVLESVADVIREATRSIDVAARYGGDELALILVETGREGAAVLGERLAERMRETEVPLREGGSMGVTLSVGVATLPDSADDLEDLVDAADRALLRAKRAGKNQIRSAPVTKARSSGDRPRHRRSQARRPTRRP